MALLLGHTPTPPLLDPHTARPDRRPRIAVFADPAPPPPPKRDPLLAASLLSDRDRSFVAGVARRPRATPGAVGFDANGNNGFDEEDDESDEEWERRMLNKIKETEEMKELERKAEELQSQVAAEREGVEETEEEKRNRVRKELEKV